MAEASDSLNISSMGSENYPDAASAARAKIAALSQNTSLATPLAPPGQPSSPLAQMQVGAIPTAEPKPASIPLYERGPAGKRTRTKLPSRTKPIVNAIATFLLLLLVFKSGVVINELRYLTRTKTASVATTPTETVPATPIISIPKINVSAPVVYESSIEEARIQKSLESGVVHYGTSALPGQKGNNVIVGHSSNDWWEPGNYKFVFVLLDKLVPGDSLSVNYESRKYTYQVTEVKVVEPTDISVLASTPEPTITLITCTPPGTSWKRLVVRGRQISPDPALAATAATTSTSSQANQLPSNPADFWQQLTDFWQWLVNTVTGRKPAQTPATTPATTPSNPSSLPKAI